jgi:UDP-N-acetylglucosamine 2-epimerase
MGNILLKLDEIFDQEKPNLVMVYGDTNTTSAAAIAASKKNIALAHVEAGLREFNKFVPEEINKLLTDSVSDLLFSPTETGIINLRKAGLEDKSFNFGDVGVDLLVNFSSKYNSISSELLQRYNLKSGEYCFMTCHRAANTDDPHKLKSILEVLSKINYNYLFPIHPRTKAAIQKHNLQHLVEKENINVIEPIGFWETQALIKNATFCLTDSGGVIKEAYFHRVQAIIIDTQSEWVETINEGWNQLVGPSTEEILTAIDKLKNKPSIHSNCLGDGTASIQIVRKIYDYINGNNK